MAPEQEHTLVIPEAVADTYTAQEIYGQPQLWQHIYEQFKQQKEALNHFYARFLSHAHGQIVLTGAGSSAFIGQSIAFIWQQTWRYPVQAVPTTDVVTHPAMVLTPENPLLLVSFARSGNSPESLHTVSLAEQLVRSVYHLLITCNDEGDLLRQSQLQYKYAWVLPPESNDRALAMTGSFTGMALAGALAGDVFQGKLQEEAIEKMQQTAFQLFTQYTPLFQDIARKPFRRAVFLGSGPLLGIARESHLKLQELTDGQVMCQFDSFLGFRHGPRAVANTETLLVYLVSPNPYVRRYEIDLMREIAELHLGLYRLAITPVTVNQEWVDAQVVLPVHLPEVLWGLVSVIPAQLLGLFTALQLGLSPDNPSKRGAISRVVQGVRLYAYQPLVGG